MSMKIMPAGDEAVVAEFGDKIDDGINRKVHVLARRIDREKIRGIKELLPTYRSLMVLYDPRIISYAALCRKIGKLEPADTDEGEGTRRTIIVPCCYEGAFAPDMPDMQKATGLQYEEIVRIHSGVDYKIYMLGFLPGFVYLGGLDPRIAVPRLTTPRTSIPARSVGIGGSQTGVYPIASPGGWRLIGSTPLEFYDPEREKPILCEAGEYIRFVPVTSEEYRVIREQVVSGEYEPVYMEGPKVSHAEVRQ